MIFLSLPTVEKTTRTQNPNGVLEAWIAAMAAENTQALAMLYEQTKTAVYGFALSLTKNSQDAEDVTQETYVRLFQAAKSYRPRGKPMAWILTITRNLSLMKLRKRKNQGTPFQDHLVADEKQEQDFSENSINRIVLKTVLQALSDEERQIVMLHSVTGLKHREIAEVLQIPLSTALSKYRRALSKLKKGLKGEKL